MALKVSRQRIHRRSHQNLVASNKTRRQVVEHDDKLMGNPFWGLPRVVKHQKELGDNWGGGGLGSSSVRVL